MTRIALVTTLVLLLTHPPASAGAISEDGCTSAFLTEHLGPEDAAVLLRLWTAGSAIADPTTNGAVGGYDGQSYARASRRFFDLRAKYQMRCSDQNIQFE